MLLYSDSWSKFMQTWDYNVTLFWQLKQVHANLGLQCYSILTVEASSWRPGITMLLYTDSLSKFMETWDYNVSLHWQFKQVHGDLGVQCYFSHWYREHTCSCIKVSGIYRLVECTVPSTYQCKQQIVFQNSVSVLEKQTKNLQMIHV